MDRDGSIRASDSDRENVAEILRVAYADGRLTLDEFDERTTAAYGAKTWAELRELTRDLPVGPNLGAAPLRAARRQGPPGGIAPGQLPPGPLRPARPPLVFPVLPLVILFLVLAGAAHTAVLIIPAVVILAVCLRMGRRGHHHGHRPGGGYPTDHGHRPGGGYPTDSGDG